MTSAYDDRPRDAMGRIGPKTGIEFTAPDGLDLKGDKGTASIRWKRGANGKHCITSINGISTGCDDEAPVMAGKNKPEDESMEPNDGPGEEDAEMS